MQGATTEVTTAAITHAAFDARPDARYYVAHFGPLPAPFIAVFARVVPTYLQDFIIEAMTTKQPSN